MNQSRESLVRSLLAALHSPDAKRALSAEEQAKLDLISERLLRDAADLLGDDLAKVAECDLTTFVGAFSVATSPIWTALRTEGGAPTPAPPRGPVVLSLRDVLRSSRGVGFTSEPDTQGEDDYGPQPPDEAEMEAAFQAQQDEEAERIYLQGLRDNEESDGDPEPDDREPEDFEQEVSDYQDHLEDEGDWQASNVDEGDEDEFEGDFDYEFVAPPMLTDLLETAIRMQRDQEAVAEAISASSKSIPRRTAEIQGLGCPVDVAVAMARAEAHFHLLAAGGFQSDACGLLVELMKPIELLLPRIFSTPLGQLAKLLDGRVRKDFFSPRTLADFVVSLGTVAHAIGGSWPIRATPALSRPDKGQYTQIEQAASRYGSEIRKAVESGRLAIDAPRWAWIASIVEHLRLVYRNGYVHEECAAPEVAKRCLEFLLGEGEVLAFLITPARSAPSPSATSELNRSGYADPALPPPQLPRLYRAHSPTEAGRSDPPAWPIYWGGDSAPGKVPVLMEWALATSCPAWESLGVCAPLRRCIIQVADPQAEYLVRFTPEQAAPVRLVYRVREVAPPLDVLESQSDSDSIAF